MGRVVSWKWFWVAGAAALGCLQAPPALALALGAGLALAWRNPSHRFTAKAGKLGLQAAVIMLGFGVKLDTVLRVGVSSVGVTLVSILFVLGLGWLLARRLGVARDLGLLVSSGTAICGGSAIAAMAPAIGASEVATAMAMAVVFLLNGVALIVFPIVGHALDLSQVQFGLWSALAIHDTSSVVGAAASYGATALAVGTTVKLVRALWVLPVSLSASRLVGGRSGATVPWFLLGFLGAALLRAVLPGADAVWGVLSGSGRGIMVATLFLIGAGMTRASLRLVGWRPLLMAVVLWLVVLCASLAAVMSGLVSFVSI